MRGRIRLGLALCGLAVAAFLLHRYLPAQHNPFRPLDLSDPVGLATYGKLTDLKYAPERCEAVLAQAGVETRALAPERTAGGCALGATLVLDKSLSPYNAAPLRMTCHQIAALFIWEAQFARPLAEELLGSPLRQIETYGSFSCRNIAGTGTRSQHAYANAIDLSGFVLEDGRRISVKQHWRAQGAEGRYLARLHRGACRLFSVTLGPDYNAAHADHFHFDMGSVESCR